MALPMRLALSAIISLVVLCPVTVPTFADTQDKAAATSKYDLSRIVSIGGDVTEILYELGFEDQIAAIDTTSQYPERAIKSKPNVGYMRALSSEGVLSMKPTVIIASKSSGPPEVIAALRSTSIPFVEISNEASAEAVLTKIDQVAMVTGVVEKGNSLREKVEAALAKAKTKAAAAHHKPRVLFVLLAQNGRALVGGQDTVAHALFALAGLENVASGINGFRPVNNESALAMDPDVVITMRRSRSNTGEQAKAVTKIEGLRQTSAIRNNNVIEIDGSYMLGFGPRVAQAAGELSQQVRRVLAKSQARVTQ